MKYPITTIYIILLRISAFIIIILGIINGSEDSIFLLSAIGVGLLVLWAAEILSIFVNIANNTKRTADLLENNS
jgi:hypothetical protein